MGTKRSKLLATANREIKIVRKLASMAPLVERIEQARRRINTLETTIIHSKHPLESVTIKVGENNISFEELIGVLLSLKRTKKADVDVEGMVLQHLETLVGNDLTFTVDGLFKEIEDLRTQLLDIFSLATDIADVSLTVSGQGGTEESIVNIARKLYEQAIDIYTTQILFEYVIGGLAEEQLAELAIPGIKEKIEGFHRMQELREELPKVQEELKQIEEELKTFEGRKLKGSEKKKKRELRTRREGLVRRRKRIRRELLEIKRAIFPQTSRAMQESMEREVDPLENLSSESQIVINISKAPLVRTSEEDLEILRKEYPNLLQLAYELSPEELAEQEREKQRRIKENETRRDRNILRRLIRELDGVGVPQEFYVPMINRGVSDANRIVEAYTLSLKQKEKPETIVKGKTKIVRGKMVGSSSRRTPRKKDPKINNKIVTVAVMKLIRARFGKNIDSLSGGKRELITGNIDKVRNFVKAYLIYLMKNEGERGMFGVNGLVEGSSFKERPIIREIIDPQGWRPFVLNVGQGRIIVCVRPESKEIGLFLAEPSHDNYVTELVRFNLEHLSRRVHVDVGERISTRIINGN